MKTLKLAGLEERVVKKTQWNGMVVLSCKLEQLSCLLLLQVLRVSLLLVYERNCNPLVPNSLCSHSLILTRTVLSANVAGWN